MPSPLEAFFLAADADRSGQRFCLLHMPRDGRVKTAIVYVHPFAEEMNKTRRMAALQSRAFADAGHAVLQIDLLGCGDSSGDFGDASWDDWVADVAQAVRWMRLRFPVAPLWLWGLRAGCLLAADAAAAIDDDLSFLFWQPSASGKPVLQQFLRLKAAADMLEGKGKGLVESLKQQLAAGASVEVAGYTLSPALAQGLAGANLLPPPRAARMVWLELASRDDAELSPAGAAALARWTATSALVHSQIVQGPAFWQTTEIEEAPALVGASLAALIAPASALAA